MPCVVRSNVSEPGDVFDMYGRFIGDIYVRLGSAEVDLNHWLLREGYAFPALYNSMTNDEISAVLALAKRAQSVKRGLWALPATDVRTLDFKRVFRKYATPSKDRGSVSFPKLFRRVSTWRVLTAAQLSVDTFNAFLKAAPDPCFTTADFLHFHS